MGMFCYLIDSQLFTDPPSKPTVQEFYQEKRYHVPFVSILHIYSSHFFTVPSGHRYLTFRIISSLIMKLWQLYLKLWMSRLVVNWQTLTNGQITLIHVFFSNSNVHPLSAPVILTSNNAHKVVYVLVFFSLSPVYYAPWNQSNFPVKVK